MKINALAIVLTFFLLWLSAFIATNTENTLAYVLILTFGVLHGANDIALVRKIPIGSAKSLNNTLILTSYIVAVGLVALLFYLIPGIALVLFVLLSGYHFGEEHWSSRIELQSIPAKLFYACYGLFILLLLFFIHASSVSEVIFSLTGSLVPDRLFLYALISVIIALGIIIYILPGDRRNLVLSFKELFFLIVFYVVFKSTTLLWAFAIYFVVWHSLPSLITQIQFLYGGFTKQSAVAYFKTSFVYWLLSISGLFVLYLLFHNTDSAFLSLLFPFIAALTLPHVLVMALLNRN